MRIILPEELKSDPNVVEAAEAIRNCVECGAANSLCPTFVTLNDDRDSPRGRNRIVRDMLESGKPPTEETVRHIDRCLSCNACSATCLARVDFMHMMDTARHHVEKHYKRPLSQRLYRSFLMVTMTNRFLFQLGQIAGRLAQPFAPILPQQLRTSLEHAKSASSLYPKGKAWRQEPTLQKKKVGTVAFLEGCVEKPLAPQINMSARRVVAACGYETANLPYAGCCGALAFHIGKVDPALESARKNIEVWAKAIQSGEIDWIVMTASGCGTMVKDYSHLFRNDPEMREKAALVSERTKDISELLIPDQLNVTNPQSLTVAYHAPCSLQHAQKITSAPQDALKACGFELPRILESHLCCGSAGSYSMLQPEISTKLKERKVTNLEAVKPDVVATSNIGCMMQISEGTNVPVVHLAELIDWCIGGPRPSGLDQI